MPYCKEYFSFYCDPKGRIESTNKRRGNSKLIKMRSYQSESHPSKDKNGVIEESKLDDGMHVVISLVCFCLSPLSQTYCIRLSSITDINTSQDYLNLAEKPLV